jgi:hypothetical protein
MWLLFVSVASVQEAKALLWIQEHWKEINPDGADMQVSAENVRHCARGVQPVCSIVDHTLLGVAVAVCVLLCLFRRKRFSTAPR